jgi:hypothetical protein
MNTKVLSDSEWYKLQQLYHDFDAITPDIKIYRDILVRKTTVDVTRSHDSLKNLLNNVPKGKGIIVISNIEISKQPLERILSYVKSCYTNCEVGVYVALLSYYITPTVVDPTLPKDYSHACYQYFNTAFNFAKTIENLSDVTDYPINNSMGNYLEEGSNFLFVHPNIRYWLWK